MPTYCRTYVFLNPICSHGDTNQAISIRRIMRLSPFQTFIGHLKGYYSFKFVAEESDISSDEILNSRSENKRNNMAI